MTNQQQQTIDGRKVGVGFTAALMAIGLAPLLHHHPVRIWALASAASVVLIALARPRWLAAFAGVVQRSIGLCLVAFAYFVILTPVAVIGRLLGRDVLKLKREPERESYWIDRGANDKASDTLSRLY